LIFDIVINNTSKAYR